MSKNFVRLSKAIVPLSVKIEEAADSIVYEMSEYSKVPLFHDGAVEEASKIIGRGKGQVERHPRPPLDPPGSPLIGEDYADWTVRVPEELRENYLLRRVQVLSPGSAPAVTAIVPKNDLVERIPGLKGSPHDYELTIPHPIVTPLLNSSLGKGPKKYFGFASGSSSMPADNKGPKKYSTEPAPKTPKFPTIPGFVDHHGNPSEIPHLHFEGTHLGGGRPRIRFVNGTHSSVFPYKGRLVIGSHIWADEAPYIVQGPDRHDMDARLHLDELLNTHFKDHYPHLAGIAELDTSDDPRSPRLGKSLKSAAARGVYADWLDEMGHPHADIVRQSAGPITSANVSRGPLKNDCSGGESPDDPRFTKRIYAKNAPSAPTNYSEQMLTNQVIEYRLGEALAKVRK